MAAPALRQMFTSTLRGAAFLCRLAPFLFWRLLLLSMMLHSGYAARDTIVDHKKKSIDAAIKDAAVFFSCIGLAYYMLPFVSFTFTDDWKQVVYDCFSPFSLWLDAIHCICVLVINLLFIKDIMERMDTIMTEFAGLLAMFTSIYHYITMKLQEANQTPENLQMTKSKAGLHIRAMVIVYMSAIILVMLQLDRKWFLPEICSHNAWLKLLAAGIAFIATASAVCCEISQFAIAIAHRVINGSWGDDLRPIFWVKLSAAIMTLLSDGYDTLNYVEVKNYWNLGFFTRCSLVISAVTTGCALILVVTRWIGPSRLKEFSDKTVKAAKEFSDKTVKAAKWAKDSTQGVPAWLEDLRVCLSNKCARVLERWVGVI